MTAEETARHLAGARSGYQLISYREVALPLFKVDLELLVLEKKPLPPIQEYVLRAVDEGLSGTAAIAGLLGIEESIVRTTAAVLLSSDNLVLAGGADGDRTHRLRLTTKGRSTAADAAQVQAVEVSLPVWIDGLTRKVLSVTARGRHWFPASQASGRGLVEIAASPRKRPGLEGIPLESVNEVIRAESAGRRGRREVIGITGIGKTRRYAREAVALAYQAPGEDLLITLAVDGESSEEHDAAFSRAIARSARKLTPEHWHGAREIVESAVPAEVLDSAVEASESERIEDEHIELRQQDERLRSAAENATKEELASLREQLAQSEKRQRELESALENISVRQVPVYEHRKYLNRALAEARERILIVSPWIRYEVVDDELVTRFRKLLQRGVQLWIAYGINKDGGHGRGKVKDEGDRDAERKLRRLGEDYPELFHMTRLGDTHAKVLVCDSRFSIITSFNWLSFRGDEQLEFRDERGYYVGLSERVQELFESYRVRFDSEAGQRATS
jgi:hypothetical protein